MSKNSSRNALALIAVIAVLLLVSLIGNVVLLTMLKNTRQERNTAKAALTDAQYEIAQLKTASAAPAAPEAEPAEEPGQATPEPAAAATPEPVPGTEPAVQAPTFVPTAKPTATPEPTPAGPYAGSKLDYEPQDSEKLPAAQTGTVICTVDVNVRSGPGTKYGKLAAVSSGSQIKVSASAYGWFLIEYKKNTFGWISGQYFFGDWMFESGLNSYLKEIEPAKEYLSAPEKITVTADNGANMRCGAATPKELVLRIDNGAVGIWIGNNGDWRLCNFQGTYGWVHKSNFQ